MKFFRSSRGEAYVAPPPAVIDPTSGKDAGAPTRTAIRPAPGSAARPPVPGRVAPQAGAKAPPGRPDSGRPDSARPEAAPPARSSVSSLSPASPSTPSPASRSARSAVPAPVTANPAAAQARPPAASTPPTPSTPSPAAHPPASHAPAAAQPGADAAQPTESRDPTGQFERRPPQPLTIASHQLAIELARGGEPVPGLARRYPHVLNQISAVWGDLPVAAEMIDDLLVDRRGGRRGFPSEVLAELLTVRRVAVKRMVGQPRKASRPQAAD